MSRSVWCSAYSTLCTHIQSFGKTRAVLMASSIRAKVKSEFSQRKKASTQGVNLIVAIGSVTPLGPKWAVPRGRSSRHGSLSPTNLALGSCTCKNRPRTRIHTLLPPDNRGVETGLMVSLHWGLGYKAPEAVLLVYIKWPEVQCFPVRGKHPGGLCPETLGLLSPYTARKWPLWEPESSRSWLRASRTLPPHTPSPTCTRATRNGEKSRDHGSLIPLNQPSVKVLTLVYF